MHEAVFFDRDGVINFDYGYVGAIKDFKLLPGITGTIKYLNNNNVKVIIITNQSGISRNYFSNNQYDRLNKYISSLFAKSNSFIDGIYTCRHAPEDRCRCRKPLPFLINQAAADHNVNKTNSLLIGDKMTDIIAGHNAEIGCNVLVRKNHIKSDGLCAAHHLIRGFFKS